MADELKTEVISVRTTPTVKHELEDLAQQVKDKKWDFPYGSPIKECDSRNGLVHQLMSGNVTVSHIRSELQKIEDP